MDAANARRARWETEARAVIERISKQCPGCKTNTEKSGMLNMRVGTRVSL